MSTSGYLIFGSASQPVYYGPTGTLVFGGSYGGALIFQGTSTPYLPPAGDALVFGWVLPGGETGECLSATGSLTLAGSATLALRQALHAAGQVSLTGSARLSQLQKISASGLLPLKGRALVGVLQGLSANGTLRLLGTVRASGLSPVYSDGKLSLFGEAPVVLVAGIAAAGTLPLNGQGYHAPTWYVPRPFVGSTGFRWGVQDRLDPVKRLPHTQADTKSPAMTSPWGRLDELTAQVGGDWDQIPKREQSLLSLWRQVERPLSALAIAAYLTPPDKTRQAIDIPWGLLASATRELKTEYFSPEPNERLETLPWGEFEELDLGSALEYSAPPAQDKLIPIVSGPHWYPRWCVRQYITPKQGLLLFDASGADWTPPSGGAVVFEYDSSKDELLCFDGTWNGPKDAYWYKPHEWEIPPPDIRRYYIVMNTVSLKRVADNIPIPIMGLDISTNLDSWCWVLSAGLRREVDLDLVRPSGGAPVEVEASINGNVWRFVVESYGHDRAYGSRGYSISGRSLSAYLADPYSLPVSRLQTSSASAAQLAASALEGTGFVSDWKLADWLVPGGVFSVNNQTPMQQLLTIAAAAGGTVQSDMAATTISLMPWYVTLPWEWGAASVVATLPSWASKRTTFEARPQYSGVYVSGHTQGVVCHIVRAGTAGSSQPQMQTDALITATEAGLARGKRILADSGPRSVESIVAPLFDNPGLLKPGTLVDVADSGVTWRGMVTSCRVSCNRPAVTQAIDVLRYHGS